MKKRGLNKTVIAFLVFGLMIAAAGCSSNTNDNRVKSATPDTAIPPLGSYKNPVGFHESVTFGSAGATYNLTQIKVVRGNKANEAIANANMFNKKPDPGYEYLFVFVGVQYVKGDSNTVNISPADFKAFIQGVECKSSVVVLPKNIKEFSSGAVMQGAVKEGFIVYEVPQNQVVIISYQPNMFDSNTVYMIVGKYVADE